MPELGFQQQQKQNQKLSQFQITALTFLAMGNEDLREEIYRAVSENPALEIVKDPASQTSEEISSSSYSYGTTNDSDNYQQILENQAAYDETLQSHLLHQLNSMKISEEELDLCTKLIYNLDKNSF